MFGLFQSTKCTHSVHLAQNGSLELLAIGEGIAESAPNSSRVTDAQSVGSAIINYFRPHVGKGKRQTKNYQKVIGTNVPIVCLDGTKGPVLPSLGCIRHVENKNARESKVRVAGIGF